MTPAESVTSRSHKFPDQLYAAATKAAEKEREVGGIRAVLTRALEAYVVDPQAFNAAVATIRGGRR